ncbi:SNF2 family N-terminal domain-containing protein [Rhodocollybia butyracea]|uniref:SNF2 family N-terminal domain-containing protein n=1 Tax=Rhodocollybia butyracea TaxID=206335 RepID=A0A9P5U0X9_9AGAR|nr:SNF2 family N-terminal domain-containing protein [Rhodocollybia butyracea]
MQHRWDTPPSNGQNGVRHNKLTSKKGALLPVELLDDVRPNPFNAPPEQNLYGKIPPESAFKFLQFQQTTPKCDERPSTKHTRVKVEEINEKKNSEDQAQSRPTYPSPSQHRFGPRKSEPLIDSLRSMSLNEPNSPSSSRDKRKSRYSEPLTGATKPAANNNPPMRNVLNVFNEPRSLNYLNLNTSVAYSEFTLKPHQAYAREWMAKQERTHGIGGLIADEMGLGKTFQAIVLIKDDKIKAQVKGLSVGPTLIVAPKSVVFQWELEIARMIKRSERLRCILYYGNQRKSKIPLSDSFLRNVDVVITTYGILVSEYHEEITHRGAIFSVNFRRVILDEADIIRNATTGSAKACFAISQNAQYCWCLTGTPIQNKINDLYSLFRFIERGMGDFSNSRWFTDNIHKPLTKGAKGSYATQAQDLLKVHLGEIMLRRRKSDRVNGAPILTLPEMVVEIWDIELSEKERAFYDLVEQRMHQILDAVLQDDMGIEFYSTVWVMLLRLRQACLHPYLLLSQKVKDAAKDAGVEEDPKLSFQTKTAPTVLIWQHVSRVPKHRQKSTLR